MKKAFGKIGCAALSLVIVLALAACAGNSQPAGTSSAPAPAPSANASVPAQEVSKPASGAGEGERYIFTDSTGRKVELPRNITRVASAGPLANIFIYAVKPEVLVGWAAVPAAHAQKYIDETYLDLPEYGKFYNNSEGFNREALMASNPEVIIDVGEWDGEYKTNLDALQEQLGIPVILIEANLEHYPAAFRTVGEVLGDVGRGEALGAYCDEVLSDAKEKAASIPEENRKTVYYGESDTGLSTILSGTLHSEIYELIGAKIAADAGDAQIQRGGGTVSMEQLLAWNPDVIMFPTGGIYETAGGDASWAALDAIKNGDYYEIPIAPYNWLSNPPGPNRVIGIRWLGNLLYPDVFNYDILQEVKDFYSLFYRYELSDAEVTELLANSTLKAS